MYTDFRDAIGLTYMMYFSTMVQNADFNGCFLKARNQSLGNCYPGTTYSYINAFNIEQFNSTIQCQIGGLYQHYISTKNCGFLFQFSGQNLYGYV